MPGLPCLGRGISCVTKGAILATFVARPFPAASLARCPALLRLREFDFVKALAPFVVSRPLCRGRYDMLCPIGSAVGCEAVTGGCQSHEMSGDSFVRGSLCDEQRGAVGWRCFATAPFTRLCAAVPVSSVFGNSLLFSVTDHPALISRVSRQCCASHRPGFPSRDESRAS
jgi:hypothetical protein